MMTTKIDLGLSAITLSGAASLAKTDKAEMCTKSISKTRHQLRSVYKSRRQKWGLVFADFPSLGLEDG